MTALQHSEKKKKGIKLMFMIFNNTKLRLYDMKATECRKSEKSDIFICHTTPHKTQSVAEASNVIPSGECLSHALRSSHSGSHRGGILEESQAVCAKRTCLWGFPILNSPEWGTGASVTHCL